MTQRRSQSEMSIVLRFSKTGFLRAILLDAPDDTSQAVLEKSFDRLVRPGAMAWLRRLFNREG